MADDLSISQMQKMQHDLWEKYSDIWPPLEPKYARDSLLWMIEELGEVISIIKKRGELDAVNDKQLRTSLVEELADVLMFFNDVLMRYNISSDEFAKIYSKKHMKNMKRDFVSEDANYLR